MGGTSNCPNHSALPQRVAPTLTQPHFALNARVCVRDHRLGDIDVKSVDEKSGSSTSAQMPAPLWDKTATNRTEDLLISGGKKMRWLVVAVCRGSGAQVIMTVASSALPPCLASSQSHWP